MKVLPCMVVLPIKKVQCYNLAAEKPWFNVSKNVVLSNSHGFINVCVYIYNFIFLIFYLVIIISL